LRFIIYKRYIWEVRIPCGSESHSWNPIKLRNSATLLLQPKIPDKSTLASRSQFPPNFINTTTKSSRQESVLITGCSAGGLGSAIALAFQAHSLYIFATARDLSKLAHLFTIPNITLLQLDVTNPISIYHAVEVVKSTGDGKLKYLVNNAGAGHTMPLLDVDIEEPKKTHDTNVWGVLRVTQACAPLILGEKGTIVNIGSTGGRSSLLVMLFSIV
jgi:hypothetical protein